MRTEKPHHQSHRMNRICGAADAAARRNIPFRFADVVTVFTSNCICTTVTNRVSGVWRNSLCADEHFLRFAPTNQNLTLLGYPPISRTSIGARRRLSHKLLLHSPRRTPRIEAAPLTATRQPSFKKSISSAQQRTNRTRAGTPVFKPVR